MHIDFETYSEAGYVLDGKGGVKSLVKGKPGLKGVGAAVYAMHPSTDVISLAWGDGLTSCRLWVPGNDCPEQLVRYFLDGSTMHAWNSFFEYVIWNCVLTRRYGFPPAGLGSFRCSMAKSAYAGYPSQLGKACEVLDSKHKKLKEGDRLIKLLCVPQKGPVTRRTPTTDPELFQRLYSYNLMDIKTERSISDLMPDMPEFDLRVWRLDQKINVLGVSVDKVLVQSMIDAWSAYAKKLTRLLRVLTSGEVNTYAETKKMLEWVNSEGLQISSVATDTVKKCLDKKDLKGNIKKVLEIRQGLSSAAPGKLHTIMAMLCPDNRLRGLYVFCGARRTRRFSGKGVQPQNLSSPKIKSSGISDAIRLLTLEEPNEVAEYYGKALADTISSCVRSVFIPGPGKVLINSDYSSIEAVVLAMLSGEQWRINVFRTHGLIYEMCASKITGIPLQKFIDHRRATGEHLSERKPFGKIPELASGYQGWIGAWKAWGADRYMNEDQIKENILRWRRDSPSIPAFWKGAERCFTAAVLHPGIRYQYRLISFRTFDGIMYVTLPSGSELMYHKPEAVAYVDDYGRNKYKLSYTGHNSNPKMGAIGWVEMETYGGKLVENITQAVATEIFKNGMLNVDNAGFDIVMHTHDEITAEVRPQFADLKVFEALMSKMPKWAEDWPIVAKGGWIGDRYRK